DRGVGQLPENGSETKVTLGGVPADLVHRSPAFGISGIGRADYTKRRIEVEDPAEGFCCAVPPVGENNHTGMLGVSHTYATSVVKRHPRRTTTRISHQVE